MLQYKTLDGSGAAGKPWVFLCALPEEAPALLDQVCGDIFPVCDCAIWYDDGLDTDPALLEDALAQSGVAVLPVTEGLLDPQGPLQRRVLPRVRAHSLALLPLLEDPTLLNAFNARFPQIQALNRRDMDSSAIPYAEKLARFLEPLLLGEDLARQVAGAFRARAFLSYRKQDRARVLKLVRFIQASPACRGIGIWYDEFLTPGKSFEDSLLGVLEDSGIFLLALTESMVREPNYVTRTEYPRAKALGKPILPLAVDPVDPEAASVHLPDLPEILTPEGAVEALGALAGPLETTAEQDMLLGLAYLHGLHVARQVQVGLEFLQRSANRGHGPAALRLATIQILDQSPQDRARDRLRWLEVYVQCSRRDYGADPGPATARVLADALNRLGEVRFPEDPARASALYEEAAACLERHQCPGELAQLLSNHAVRLSESGRSRDALTRLFRVRKLLVQLQAEPDRLACCDYNIGIAALELGMLDLAGQANSSAIGLLTPLAEAQPRQHNLVLAQSYSHLAMGYRRRWEQGGDSMDFWKAQQCHQTALKLLHAGTGWDRTVFEPALATEYIALANLLIQGKMTEPAQKRLDLAIAIFQAYGQDRPGVFRRQLAEALGTRGNLHMGLERYAQAAQDYETALVLFRMVPGQGANWALSLWNLANAYSAQGQYGPACACYRQAMEFYDSGAVQGAAYSTNHALCCTNYGFALLNMGQHRAASQWLTRAIGLYQDIQARSPGAFEDRIRELRALVRDLDQG